MSVPGLATLLLARMIGSRQLLTPLAPSGRAICEPPPAATHRTGRALVSIWPATVQDRLQSLDESYFGCRRATSVSYGLRALSRAWAGVLRRVELWRGAPRATAGLAPPLLGSRRLDPRRFSAECGSELEALPLQAFTDRNRKRLGASAQQLKGAAEGYAISGHEFLWCLVIRCHPVAIR
jgi:hypothetical protein